MRRLAARFIWNVANAIRRAALWLDPGPIEEWEHLYMGSNTYMAAVGLKWQKAFKQACDRE